MVNPFFVQANIENDFYICYSEQRDYVEFRNFDTTEISYCHFSHILLLIFALSEDTFSTSGKSKNSHVN